MLFFKASLKMNWGQTYLTIDSSSPNKDRKLGNSTEVFIKKVEKLKNVATTA